MLRYAILRLNRVKHPRKLRGLRWYRGRWALLRLDDLGENQRLLVFRVNLRRQVRSRQVSHIRYLCVKLLHYRAAALRMPTSQLRQRRPLRLFHRRHRRPKKRREPPWSIFVT